MESLTIKAGYSPKTSYYATTEDNGRIYIGGYNKSDPGDFIRCVYPPIVDYLKELGKISDSQTIKISSATFSLAHASGKGGSISLQARFNNNNSDSGLEEGTSFSVTAPNTGNATYEATWNLDSTTLNFLLTSTQSIVVHVKSTTYKSGKYFGACSSNYNSTTNKAPRLVINYEVIEDSGGGDDSGDGDDSGGEDTEETVTLDNITAYLNTSSPTIGNTLSVTVSGAPSGSSYGYSWYLNNTSLGTSSSSWYSGNINVSSYFEKTSNTSSGYVAVTVSYGTLTKTLYLYFTLYLTSSYGPSNLTYSDKSSHSSGSYIPGSKIIWSASATANYGASISRYVLTVNSVTETVYGTSVSNYTSSILPMAQGTYNASIDAYDSRGYSVSRSFTITVSSNIAPIINAKVIRCDANGDENMINGEYYKLTGTVSADQTSGMKITSLNITASQDGSTNPTISKEPKVASYNLSNIGVQALPTGAETSFEVKIIASDGKMSREITLFGPSAAYIIHIATGGKSLGLGSAASKAEKTIACGWKLLANGGLEMDGSQITINNCLPISQGGTGASTAEGARANLGIPDIDLNKYITSDALNERLTSYLSNTVDSFYFENSVSFGIKRNNSQSSFLQAVSGSKGAIDLILGTSMGGACYIKSSNLSSNKIATIGDIPTIIVSPNAPTDTNAIWLKPAT